MPLTSRLLDLVDRIERTSNLESPELLRERIALLDRLDELDDLTPSPCIDAARARLERANHLVYDDLRAAIRRGDGRSAFAPWITTPTSDAGYDALDDIVAGVLQFDELGSTLVEPTPDMVFYQPTPARHIFDLLNRTALNERDVLVDLGAGLGHVPMLAAIATPAHAIGIEIEPAYITCARRAAERLGLDRVTFLQSDAQDADLADGTVFYLYTPFGGAMLRAMLDRLAAASRTRPIRVCSFGPCSAVVAAEPWLETDDVVAPDHIVIHRSTHSS